MRKQKEFDWVPVFVGIIVVVVIAVAVIAAIGISKNSFVPGTQVEVEDCDAEDRANREAECGFLPQVTTTKPAPKKSAAKTTRT